MADARVEVGIEFALPLFRRRNWWRLMSEHVNTWREFVTPNPGSPCLPLHAPPAQNLMSHDSKRKKGHCIESILLCLLGSRIVHHVDNRNCFLECLAKKQMTVPENIVGLPPPCLSTSNDPTPPPTPTTKGLSAQAKGNSVDLHLNIPMRLYFGAEVPLFHIPEL